jgi:hypothetical protein
MTRKKCLGRKAQSVLIGHSVAISMTIILVIVVVISLNNVRNQYQKFVGENEIDQICLSVKGTVEEIYYQKNYTSPTNTTVARVRLELPSKVADKKYSARFFNNSVLVYSDDIRFNRTCKIGFSATFIGTSDGGPTYITWYRFGNGSEEIRMVPV